MTDFIASEKQIERDQHGNIARVIETLTDRRGRLHRITKVLIRDANGNASGVTETVEHDIGWDAAMLEAQRDRFYARSRAEKATRHGRMSNVTELEKTSDGAYRTRARSGR